MSLVREPPFTSLLPRIRDFLAIDQPYGIEFQGNLGPDSQDAFTFYSSDRAMSDGTGRNDGETLQVNVADHDKIDPVADMGFRRGDVFRQLQRDGSSIWEH